MNIPFEMIIIAVAAIAMLAVGIVVVVKKRSQEIDDDYQWSDEHREKRAKRNSKSKVQNNKSKAKDDAIIYNSATLSNALEADLNRIKKELEDAANNSTDESEEYITEEDVYVRKSYATGKHSKFVTLLTMAIVVITNLSLWIFIQPIDQNVVAIYDDIFPFNWVGAIVVTTAEALLLPLFTVEAYEVLANIPTKEELKASNTSKLKSIIMSLLVFAIGVLMVLFCKYTYDVITEDGYESPGIISDYRYEWADMAWFDYEKEPFLSFPYVMIYDKTDYIHLHLDLKVSRYKHMTTAAEGKYGKGNHMDMVDYIFLEKYAYINEQANQEIN